MGGSSVSTSYEEAARLATLSPPQTAYMAKGAPGLRSGTKGRKEGRKEVMIRDATIRILSQASEAMVHSYLFDSVVIQVEIQNQ